MTDRQLESKTYSFYYDLGGRYINWKFMFATKISL